METIQKKLMLKIRRSERVYLATTAKIVGLAGLFLVLASNFVVRVNAADDKKDASTKVEVNIAATLDVKVSDTVKLAALPGDFVSAPATVAISSNSQYGYTMMLSSMGNDNKMKSDATEVTVDSDFANQATAKTIPERSWGYSLDNTNFSAIPTSSAMATINKTDKPLDKTRHIKVYFGAKPGMDNVASDYIGTVLITTFVNGADGEPIDNSKKSGIFSISSMQDMTSNICKATTTPSASATKFDWSGMHKDDKNYVPRTVLSDTRDGKKYLISKLADGNCWMSQNLGLDLKDGTALTSSDSDINSTNSWTPENSTETKTGNKWANGKQTPVDHDYSFRPTDYGTYYKSGTTVSNTPTDNSDEYLYESSGNYYNFYAATAGSGNAKFKHGDTKDSICPKGWQLPRYSGSQSYGNLLSKYGFNGSYSSSLVLAPLNFNLSGLYNNVTGMGQDQGGGGFYWTASSYNPWNETEGAADDTKANILYINTSSIDTKNYAFKTYGYNVRCVAK